MLTFRVVALLLAICLDLGLGLLVYFNAPKKIVNRFFLSFLISAAVWTVGVLTILYVDDPRIINIGQYLFMIGPMFVSLFVYYVTVFYESNSQFKKIQYAPLAFSILSSIVVALAIESLIKITVNPGQNSVIVSSHYVIYALYFTAYLLVYGTVLVVRMRRSSGILHKQLRYLLFLITISTLFITITNLIIPIYRQNTDLIWVGPLAILLFSSGMAYAIFKHKLFDLKIFTARLTAYIFAAITSSLIFFFIILGALNLTTGNKLSLSQQVLYVFIAVISAFSFQTLKNKFDKLTNRLFYRDAYDTQLFLDELNGILVTTIELEPLLVKSSSVIVNNIKADYCSFAIKGDQQEESRFFNGQGKQFSAKDIHEIHAHSGVMRRKIIVTSELIDEYPELHEVLTEKSIAVLVGMVTHSEKVGYMILGAKKSGNPYSSTDIKMFEIIADELALAIQNSLRFEEIANFNVTLQQKITDATKELKKSNDKLKALDEAKDEFISMASHQLRTPLTSVKGYLSMVLEGDTGPIKKNQQQMLQQAYDSSQRMVYLIADLLNVSRLRTGKFVIENKDTYLPDVVETEIHQLKETAEVRNLKLNYDKPSDFPHLMIDETKVRQVIMNFLDNAIYYTPSGGSITALLEKSDSSITFKVVDTGLGVPKAEQHHLFTKFYRAGNAKKARPDGTGLGLFMAKKVIVAQGGAIIFQSEQGKGSTFGFTLPLQSTQQVVNSVAQVSEMARSEA